MLRNLPVVKWILPGLFAIYALLANLQIWWETPYDFLTSPTSGGSLITGDTAARIDGYYRENLPHIPTSVGLIGAIRYQMLNEMRTGGWAGKDNWLFSQEELRAMANPDGAQKAADHIAALSYALAGLGTRLVLVPIPAKIDIYAAQANKPASAARMASLHHRFLASLKAKDIAHIDIRPALKQAAKSADVFFQTDTHWTEYGAGIAAQTVSASGYIPQGLQTFTRRPQQSKPLAGDLVGFVTTPRFASFAGLPKEYLTPYLAVPDDPDLNSLFAAPVIDLVLVGTSYSANENWSFAQALKLSLNRDVLNTATSGLGPVLPLHRYMDSPGFRDSPPKNILWEFPIRYLSDPDLWDRDPEAKE